MYSLVLMVSIAPSGDMAAFGKNKGESAVSGCNGNGGGGFLGLRGGRKSSNGCSGYSDYSHGGCTGYTIVYPQNGCGCNGSVIVPPGTTPPLVMPPDGGTTPPLVKPKDGTTTPPIVTPPKPKDKE